MHGAAFSLDGDDCTTCVCRVGPRGLGGPQGCSRRPPAPIPLLGGASLCWELRQEGDVSPCPQGGEVECSFAPCPMLDCPQHQRHLGPGQCCVTCRDPPAPAGEPALGDSWGQGEWDGGTAGGQE